MALTLNFTMPSFFRIAWVSEVAKDMWEPRLEKLRSVVLGRANLSTADMEWVFEILDWPMKWDSLHGIGILTLPVCRIVTSAEAVAAQEVIEHKGTRYPVEGARSPVFPFLQTQPLVFRKADTWTDNGFSSAEAMKNAHKVIIDTAKELLITNHRDIQGDKVLDLGCGNGKLLEEICNATPGVLPYGIEQNPQRCARAILRLQNLGGDAFPGNLFDFNNWSPPYSLALFSANRLREVSEDCARGLLERLAVRCRRVIAYSYRGDEPVEPHVLSEAFSIRTAHGRDGTEVVVLEPK